MDHHSPGRIKAVGFDVDGTLYANARMYLRTLPWGLRNWRLVRAFSRARREIRVLELIEDFYGLQAELTARALGSDAATARRLIEDKVYGDWERALAGIRLEPRLVETLDLLRSRGLRLGVLSDFPIERKLGLLGLEGRFDFVASAEQIGRLKPHPAPFQALAEGLGLPPNEILYVGNSYKYDILGARGVGMMTAHFAKKPRKDSLANFTFSNYVNLCDWVAENS